MIKVCNSFGGIAVGEKKANMWPTCFNSVLSSVTLLTLTAFSNSVCAKDRWVQIHADVAYTRNYSYTKNDPKYQGTTQAAFTLNGSLDQMMWRMDPKSDEKYPTYITMDDMTQSFKNAGTVTMKASFQSNDLVAKRKDNGNANLSGNVKIIDDFRIERIAPETILGVALSAEIKLTPKLNGSVNNTLSALTGTPAEGTILMWVMPVNFDNEQKSFISNIQLYARTPLGPRPKDVSLAKLYDLQVAANELSTMAQVGGASVAVSNAVVTGSAEAWTMICSVKREVPVNDRGSYQETLTLTIKPVATSLPVPPNPED